MLTLVIQIVVLCLVATAAGTWGFYFPHPSPFIRRWLPARKRWPEAQVRQWLRDGNFQLTFVDYFYRDPERVPPPEPGVLAPADGLVTGAEVRHGICYLVIALSFWDMHVQRSPGAGKVIRVESLGQDFMDGEGRQFTFLREKCCPVQKRIVMQSDWGELAVRLVTSLAARRIETWVVAGEKIARAQRIGRILLGSTVVLELPATVGIVVRSGERVWAGQTVVAKSPVSA